MATLDDVNNKQLQTQDPSIAPSTSASAPQVSAGGAGDVTSGVSTAGVGAGGTGGWTNIQAYLAANNGNNSSADNLTNTVGKQFGQDSDAINQGSADSKAQGQTAVDNDKIAPDQAKSMLDQYVNPDVGTDPSGIKSKIQASLTNQYQGPGSYAAPVSGQSQNYGDALKTDQGFQGLMGQLYNTAAGGQISNGQLALQNELDINNPNITTARNNLSSQYQKLSENASKANTDTNNALQADQSAYTANQDALKNYLQNQSGLYYSQYQGATAPVTPLPTTVNPKGPVFQKPTMAPPVDPRTSANYYNAINTFMQSGAGTLDPNWQAPVVTTPVYNPGGNNGPTNRTDPNSIPGLFTNVNLNNPGGVFGNGSGGGNTNANAIYDSNGRLIGYGGGVVSAGGGGGGGAGGD